MHVIRRGWAVMVPLVSFLAALRILSQGESDPCGYESVSFFFFKKSPGLCRHLCRQH